uniref:Uncharacterized protein n=1 Tax=Aegilops tauschii subsp. strangulata TaxID=200361 RepID=A0A453D4A8_AEGTS
MQELQKIVRAWEKQLVRSARARQLMCVVNSKLLVWSCNLPVGSALHNML